MRAIVEGALAVVPGARWAGISLIRGRLVEARVPIDPLVAELDMLQSDLDDGPCLDALRTHRTVLIDDMASETRWPRFTPPAAERGVGSLLSFQLFVHGKTLGALNLYAGVSGTFSDDSIFIGELLAQHASVAMAGNAAQAQFDSAVASRDAIGQAKGILMFREKSTGAEDRAHGENLAKHQHQDRRHCSLAHRRTRSRTALPGARLTGMTVTTRQGTGS